MGKETATLAVSFVSAGELKRAFVRKVLTDVSFCYYSYGQLVVRGLLNGCFAMPVRHQLML